MGYWCTLHLFDHDRFYSETVPELKGQKGDLLPSYMRFLQTHIIGGIKHLSDKETENLALTQLDNIYKISNSFNSEFNHQSPFHTFKNYELELKYLGELNGHYDFCKFFEYYIFEQCADFYPHVPLGKGGIGRNFELKTNSLSYEVISKLDSWNSFFLQDTFGITNWITNEDIEALHLDKNNLEKINIKIADSILNLVKLAIKNKLGFIAGVDLNIERNELLPQNKLLSSSIWKNKEFANLLFKYETN
jgi:hypothetical protein